MPLTQFSVTDRNIITTSLMLDRVQLEDGSKLYTVLEEIEAQDQRLPGLNRVQAIRMLLAEINGLQSEVQSLQSDPAESFANAGIKRYSLDRVYTVEYAEGAIPGDYAAVKTALDEKLKLLEAYLGLPWELEDAVFPVVWV